MGNFVEWKHLHTALCSNGHRAPNTGKETAQNGINPVHRATLCTNSHYAYRIWYGHGGWTHDCWWAMWKLLQRRQLCIDVRPEHVKLAGGSYFFFFFHWHYSPLWALACRTMSFHFFLSATNSLHLLTLLSALEDLFLLPLSILSWVFPFASSLPGLEWRSFWASYPPPFSPGDLTNLFFALLSILLHFLLCSSLIVLGSSYFFTPRFHNYGRIFY